jgi:hypothetical protein
MLCLIRAKNYTHHLLRRLGVVGWRHTGAAAQKKLALKRAPLALDGIERSLECRTKGLVQVFDSSVPRVVGHR